MLNRIIKKCVIADVDEMIVHDGESRGLYSWRCLPRLASQTVSNNPMSHDSALNLRYKGPLTQTEHYVKRTGTIIVCFHT